MRPLFRRSALCVAFVLWIAATAAAGNPMPDDGLRSAVTTDPWNCAECSIITAPLCNHPEPGLCTTRIYLGIPCEDEQTAACVACPEQDCWDSEWEVVTEWPLTPCETNLCSGPLFPGGEDELAVEAILTHDVGAVRRLLSQPGTAFRLNAERLALQAVGCGEKIVLSLRMNADFAHAVVEEAAHDAPSVGS